MVVKWEDPKYESELEVDSRIDRSIWFKFLSGIVGLYIFWKAINNPWSARARLVWDTGRAGDNQKHLRISGHSICELRGSYWMDEHKISPKIFKTATKICSLSDWWPRCCFDGSFYFVLNTMVRLLSKYFPSGKIVVVDYSSKP